MKTYTAETAETTVGLLPKFRRTVTQHRVLVNGELYGYADSHEEAQKAAEFLNRDEEAYQKMVADSGLPEWEFLDKNAAG